MKWHLCFADDCIRPVPFNLLLCRIHWRAVPESIRSEVAERYGDWRTADAQPEHLAIVRSLVELVAEREARHADA